MNCVNLVISACSLHTVIASAIAAWKSATLAKTANNLAKEALTKRPQSELFLKVLLLMTDFINNDNNDADFSMVFDGRTAAERLPLLKELDALSPKFRASFKEDTSLADLLKRMSSLSYSASTDDLMRQQNMIDLLQYSQRKELSNL